MTSVILLIKDIFEFNVIPDKILNDKNIKKFTFDFNVHEILKNKKIEHEIADNLLTEEDRLKIFNQMLEFRKWYSTVTSKDLEFENVNILKLFDTHEFSSYLMPNLINFILIKKIIEKEKPEKIISTSIFKKFINLFSKNSPIQTEYFINKLDQKLLWDKITIKYDVGKFSISFNLSKKLYLKFKKIVELTLGFFYNFWSFNDLSKKSIIFLEFNPAIHSTLLNKLKNYHGNILLINRRRSAVWNKKSIDIVRHSDSKIVNFDRILDKNEKLKLPLLVTDYSKKLEVFWENSDFFNNLFQINDYSFWDIIREDLKRKYDEKLSDFIFSILSVKKLLAKNDVKCIVSLNDVGETEKAFLEFNNEKIPSILLEHGFIERVKETKQFDYLDFIYFKGKLAVMGETRKKWLCEEFNIDPNRIISLGSPRHDDYFNCKLKNNNKNKITILLAPNPIGDISGLSSTDLKLRVNNVILKILSTVKQLDNFQIIVKLHSSQLKHNEEMNSFIKNYDNTIPIYLSKSVIDTINDADLVIVMSPETYGTSTMILESMILGKPTINIVFNQKPFQFEHVKSKAVFIISEHDELEEKIRKILLDKNIQNEIIKNADKFVNKFLSNPGIASEKILDLLRAY
tara:strand:- start:4563 stop:6446 length:1884 start_codon:yes stop_codon:yes gene_type:complete